MKKSLGLLSRAVLIGVSAMALVAPAALADPATGAPNTEQQDKKTPQEQIAAFGKLVDKLEKDVDDVHLDVDKAKTLEAAKQVKEKAAKLKEAATALVSDLQKFLDEQKNLPSEDRVKANQLQSRAKKAVTSAGNAVNNAADKIKSLEKPAAKADIAVVPDTAKRGEVVAIVVFCPEGKVTGFASSAIDIVPDARFEEDNVVAVGGFVKKDATPGKHTATANCGSEKLTATFTVSADAPTQTKPPTSDDVRRKAIVKPKGKIETGGGATALSQI